MSRPSVKHFYNISVWKCIKARQRHTHSQAPAENSYWYWISWLSPMTSLSTHRIFVSQNVPFYKLLLCNPRDTWRGLSIHPWLWSTLSHCCNLWSNKAALWLPGLTISIHRLRLYILQWILIKALKYCFWQNFRSTTYTIMVTISHVHNLFCAAVPVVLQDDIFITASTCLNILLAFFCTS